MIGIDTNVVLRYLLKDDKLQTAKAERILEHTLKEDGPGFVSLVTVLETFWVLESFYKFSGQEIISAIEQLIRAETLFIQNEREVYYALQVVKKGEGTFNDVLVSALSFWSGCTHTLTFDRKASRLPGFKLIA